MTTLAAFNPLLNLLRASPLRPYLAAIKQVWRYVYQTAALLWPHDKSFGTTLWLLYAILFIRSRPMLNAAADRKAVDFVGVYPHEGKAQLLLLVFAGCRKEQSVLEIGCGTLMAGYPLMQFLNKKQYTGIDPNRWLIDAASSHACIEKQILRRKPAFMFNDQFDATADGVRYDYILSHSVLNHCDLKQLNLFLQNASRVLTQDGKILASLRFAEGNCYGYPPSDRSDGDFIGWQYPYTSAFSRDAIFAAASENNFRCTPMERYTHFMTRIRRCACQDWVVFTRDPPTSASPEQS